MVYAQCKLYPRKWHTWNSLRTCDTKGSPIPCQRVRPWIDLTRKKTSHLVDFAVSNNNRVKKEKGK